MRIMLLLLVVACHDDDAPVETDCEGTTWYADADSDGFGDAEAAVEACEAPAGHLARYGDCDDADPAVHPEVDEVCDGADQDCDGAVDEDASGAPRWYTDSDADGYGAGLATTSCTQPPGLAATGGDCDDADATVHPSAAEMCDHVDQDCDGTIDEDAIDPVTWYRDADEDGYGDGSAPVASACEGPSGAVADASDCDDADAAIHPGATEWCNGWDDDCDGLLDQDDPDDAGDATWYGDADLDGWGVPDSTLVTCIPPSGWASWSTDCDDTDPAIHPDATEVRGDSVDDDCDGRIPYDVSTSAAAMTWTGLGGEYPQSFASTGDPDGDGLEDYAISTLGSTPTSWSSGLVYLVDGAARGTASIWPAEGSVKGVGIYRYGPDGPMPHYHGDWFARSMSSAGDPDGDGIDELWVGAPCDPDFNTYDPDTVVPCDLGKVYLYSADFTGDVSVHANEHEAEILGNGDYFGLAVANAGDVDAAGADDVLIGTAGNAAYVFYAPFADSVDIVSANVVLLGRSGDDAGQATAGRNDIDGDGLPELVVGAPGNDTVYVVSTPATGTSPLYDYASASPSGSGAGTAVASPGDVDGDGYADVLVGGSASGSDEVWLYFGSPSGSVLASAGATLSGPAGSGVGEAIAGGDVDGDAVSDVLIGGPNVDTDATRPLLEGQAWLMYGPITAGTYQLDTQADVTFNGDAWYNFGAAVGTIGDADADGANDILISGDYYTYLFTGL